MNSDFHDEIPQTPADPAVPRRTIWQKIGLGSLSISLMFHMILLAIGVVWVLQVIPPPAEKSVDFMPVSGGGGSPASESKARQQRVQMMPPDLSRVVAEGATSNFVLPEPNPMAQLASLGSLSAGGLAGGLGGSGAGGGRGTGTGLGIGSGMAPGLGDGTGNKNPFGMISGERGALIGSFYDLKQTNDRKPTNMTDDEMRREVAEIVKRGFKESAFRKYYKAPRELYQTKLHIPVINADSAPAAFECEKEVQPRRWIVVYRGAVQAPKSGKFRFVGTGDDLLAVRFNDRPVFDYGYTLPSTGTHLYGRSKDLDGTNQNSELAREIRRASPMELPLEFYAYEQTPRYNRDVGGLAVGPEFEVEAGKIYPVEILIGEIPGGFFGVSLMIEEIGASYQKDPAGFPILPLFRLDGFPPSDELKGEAPPFAADGPIWKSAPGSAKREI